MPADPKKLGNQLPLFGGGRPTSTNGGGGSTKPIAGLYTNALLEKILEMDQRQWMTMLEQKRAFDIILTAMLDEKLNRKKAVSKDARKEEKKEKKDKKEKRGGLTGGLSRMLGGLARVGAGVLKMLGPAIAVVATAAMAYGFGKFLFNKFLGPWMDKAAAKKLELSNITSRMTVGEQSTIGGEKAFHIPADVTKEERVRVGIGEDQNLMTETQARGLAKERGQAFDYMDKPFEPAEIIRGPSGQIISGGHYRDLTAVRTAGMRQRLERELMEGKFVDGVYEPATKESRRQAILIKWARVFGGFQANLLSKVRDASKQGISDEQREQKWEEFKTIQDRFRETFATFRRLAMNPRTNINPDDVGRMRAAFPVLFEGGLIMPQGKKRFPSANLQILEGQGLSIEQQAVELGIDYQNEWLLKGPATGGGSAPIIPIVDASTTTGGTMVDVGGVDLSNETDHMTDRTYVLAWQEQNSGNMFG